MKPDGKRRRALERGWRRGLIAGVAVILIVVLHTAVALSVSAAPACTGRDMLAELEAKDPAAHARVRAAAESTSNARAVLWRVERDGMAPSHLFGTVHLTDDRVTTLTANVRDALAGARSVALEIADTSPKSLAAAMARLRDLAVFTDGRTLDDLLEDDEIEIVRNAMRATGVPHEMTDTFRPWLVTLSLVLAPCERQRTAEGLLPLDARLAEAGRRRGIPIVGLETIESQLRVMASMPEADQLHMLRVSLAYYDRAADLMETTLRLYLARDLGALWPFQLELARKAGLPADALQEFERRMVGARNAGMREAALPLLQEGGIFIAVGALHLPGPQGLVAMLREAGFTLTAVE